MPDPTSPAPAPAPDAALEFDAALHRTAAMLGCESGLDTTEYAITKHIVSLGSLLTGVGVIASGAASFFPGAVPASLGVTLIAIGASTAFLKGALYTMARNNRKIQNDAVLLAAIQAFTKTAAVLVLACMIFCGSACFTTVAFDAETLRQIDQTATEETAAFDAAQAAIPTSNAIALSGVSARRNAAASRLANWRIYEAHKNQAPVSGTAN